MNNNQNEEMTVTNEDLQKPINKMENNLVLQKKHRGLMIASFIFLVLNTLLLLFDVYIMYAVIKSLGSEEGKEVLGGIIILIVLGIPLVIGSDIYIFVTHVIFLISHITKAAEKRANRIEKVQLICFIVLTVLFVAANIIFFALLKK